MCESHPLPFPCLFLKGNGFRGTTHSGLAHAGDGATRARESMGTRQHAIGSGYLVHDFPREADSGHCRKRAMPAPPILNAFAVINTQSQHC